MTNKRVSLHSKPDIFASTAAAPPPQVPDQAPAAGRGGKYTIILDGATQAALLADESRLTALLGYQPKRRAIFLALLAMLHEDPDLLTATARRLAVVTA